jgi:heme-degrading monooxygenase HmoA
VAAFAKGPIMLVILFRSRLTPAAGADYQAMEAELAAAVEGAPGFLGAKSFVADDGERLTVVWWRDAGTLEQWRNLPRHREAQATGRARWYERYEMEVAEVVRTSRFERTTASELTQT